MPQQTDVHAMASALLEKETLEGRDIDEIMGIKPEDGSGEEDKK